MRAHAKGIVQAHRPRADGRGRRGRRPPSVLHLQHHPTGEDRDRQCDWVVCCGAPAARGRAVARAAGRAAFPVHRVGDCLAPRRAHAAVIEGDRVAVAL